MGRSISGSVSSPTLTDQDNMRDDIEPIKQDHMLATPQKTFINTEIKEPQIGMKFGFEEDACEYYKVFALAHRFGIRKGTTHNNKDRQRIDREINCFGEMFRVEKDVLRKVNIPQSICGCKAKLCISLNSINEWVVTKFVNDHNHAIVCPRKARLIQSHRTILNATTLMINSISSALMKSRNIYDIFTEQARGIENLQCSQKDIENHIAKNRRKLKGEDGNRAMQWLYGMNESNPSFFYKVKLDEDGHLISMLWVDVMSRVLYHHFLGMVTFDTTRKMNLFSMLFALILGVNHHYNTIFFGFALIFDEKIESFVCVFETWLEAMSGLQPGVIITDQDHAITTAWVDANVADAFTAGMSTTQRSEDSANYKIEAIEDNVTVATYKCLATAL
ncbi:protein FAR1-RELATED SEQUENCE 5-like [Amborella trichopoda]|uniref:protein FAR1-RELATED SEQUENCE 5-like n=1 Tax=Amborella trichopoda TaxID=13333 RepID=UPI0005D3B66C|nr:protein FAR1-RELATED SEQUENCE 5-like [Amborella trichopoda]|eukprot:XP_011622101.1 protein FAR1-RELATED SEQUENCE 5-like [Amborella trichopoda]